MQFKSDLFEFADSYEYFIFDIWGIIHDGSELYPNVVCAISALRQKNKKICFLSNAPRRASKVAEVLERLGIKKEFYDFIITSGEAAYFDLKKNQENDFKNFGKNYLYIGPKKDLGLLDGLNYNMVNEAKDADFALATGFDHDNATIKEKLPQIIDAKNHNLPLICVNPDFMVVRQDGSEALCAGVIAKEYEKMAGLVIYYGKPYEAVYKIVCEMFKFPDNSKILAIGDALETDIKGANNFKIDCALVTSGILSNKLHIKYGETADKNKLEVICKNYNLFPTFVIPKL
ncbi:MAG: TIGR01459 family HAD-type hydrolase [Rickettsiales bacterium]|nr:TIGR01459 family HAD-type hydrolase [Rickettsiales bacterium]